MIGRCHRWPKLARGARPPPSGDMVPWPPTAGVCCRRRCRAAVRWSLLLLTVRTEPVASATELDGCDSAYWRFVQKQFLGNGLRPSAAAIERLAAGESELLLAAVAAVATPGGHSDSRDGLGHTASSPSAAFSASNRRGEAAAARFLLAANKS